MIGKYKILIIITLIGVFGLGVVGGYFGERYLRHVRADQRRDNRPHFPSLKVMAQELGLSDEQQDRIREVFRQNEDRFKGLRGLMRAKLDEIRAQLKSEIEAVLTTEQRQKFEAMIDKYLRERRAEMEKRQEPGRDSKKEPKREPKREPGGEPKGDLK